MLTNLAENLCSGTTFVTVTDAQNCSSIGTVNIGAGPSTVAAAFTAPSVVYLDQGGTITFVNNSTGAVGYSWDFGDGNGSTATSPTYTYSMAGVYTVTLIATFNGCADTASMEVAVSPNSGVEEWYSMARLSVWPNPASELVMLELTGVRAAGDVLVLDALGAVVHRERMEGARSVVRVDALPAGVYWIGVDAAGRMLGQRLVVVR